MVCRLSFRQATDRISLSGMFRDTSKQKRESCVELSNGLQRQELWGAIFCFFVVYRKEPKPFAKWMEARLSFKGRVVASRLTCRLFLTKGHSQNEWISPSFLVLCRTFAFLRNHGTSLSSQSWYEPVQSVLNFESQSTSRQTANYWGLSFQQKVLGSEGNQPFGLGRKR